MCIERPKYWSLYPEGFSFDRLLAGELFRRVIVVISASLKRMQLNYKRPRSRGTNIGDRSQRGFTDDYSYLYYFKRKVIVAWEALRQIWV